MSSSVNERSYEIGIYRAIGFMKSRNNFVQHTLYEVIRDVKTPVRENYIPKLIAQQSKNKVGLITIESVLAGEDSLKKALVEARADNNRIILIDAITDEDIDVISKVLVELQWNVLSVDPGALTEKLALYRKIDKKSKFEKAVENITKNTNKETDKIVIIAAGSATEVTKKQIV